ncbi:MAG: HD domain-containing protein [Spirochaetia bacterium]
MSEQSIQDHLYKDYTEPVRDPLWKHIYLSPGLIRIMQTREVQKLSRIKQLGPAHLVYPGATHTRLNHSIGVFHIAKRMISALLRYSDCAQMTVDGVKAFLTACFLHDLGHFPYAHSLKELPLKEHESLTAEILLEKPLREIIRDDVGADPRMVAAIVDENIEHQSSEEILFFRNLLSGVLDPDKLDYLNRDAYFCGVPYGIQDIDFIISQMRPHRIQGIAISEKGLAAVENVLFSKYLMYKSVFWHKAVRIATAMIKKAILLGMEDGYIREEMLYRIDDDEFYRIFSDIRYAPFELIQMVSRRELYKAVVEIPISALGHLPKDTFSIAKRDNLEKEIINRIADETKQKVHREEVILDIPEPISFEIDIPIHGGESEQSFSESMTVFTSPVVSGFTRNLRKIRLIVPQHIAQKLDEPVRVLPWTL